MNWHARYSQQANWTRNLREYLFTQIGLKGLQRVLEVGCGTGAILSQLDFPTLHGLDIQPVSLMEARSHAPAASLICGDALSLPYVKDAFDITFCHFLLLWVSDPIAALNEMKRVTKPGGYVLALAEPDYSARVDQPPELAVLGRWQAEALHGQGADVNFGRRLAESFFQADIELVETGTIEKTGNGAPTAEELELEWAVLETDLTGIAPAEEFQRMKMLDKQSWKRGERVLHVPTYFAWGRV